MDRRERPRTRAAKASSPYFDSDDHLGTALSAEKKYRTKTDDPWHTGQEAEQDQLIARSRINLGGTPRSSLRNKKKKKPRTPETITLSSDSEPETDFENKPLQVCFVLLPLNAAEVPKYGSDSFSCFLFSIR